MAHRPLILFAALLALLALAPDQAAAEAQNRVGAFFSAAHACAPANPAESSCTRRFHRSQRQDRGGLLRCHMTASADHGVDRSYPLG